jgi:hypothetical protein
MTNCFNDTQLGGKEKVVMVTPGDELVITGGLYKTPVTNSVTNSTVRRTRP